MKLTETLLINLVKTEAENLKKFATQKQLARLDFSKLNPDRVDLCIYGQMTGNCFNDTAEELIRLSCKQGIKDRGDLFIVQKSVTLRITPSTERNFFWSPIEMFIAQETHINNGNVRRLVEYLKGETETLTFK